MLVQAVAAFAMSSAQVIGEPTEKLTVEIVHHGDDSGGEQFVFHLIDEEQLELRRIQGIRDRARDAILRSQAEDQPLDVLETDIILIRLDLLEDRNSGMKDVLGAIELLERKLKVRQASTGSPPRI